MIRFIGRAVHRMRGWAARRPVSVLVALGLVGAAAAATGGYYAFQTFDYVEHDNDFCLSCHLMREPFELFAESAHQGLGCKACHKPTFAARSQMALTQIIENPDTILTHAEVPNEKCASCHIEGDPDKWETVANSAGHRVHLESDDPALRGLMCVECHSSSLHQFAATDETCAQSGCHTDVTIQLGRMGDFTIHCAACHGFSAPLADTAGVVTALAALAPGRNECLSCHVMRTLVDMPPDEPHGQVCASCHNPHTQATPAEAVETCATVGCHSDVQELTAFHRGLGHPVVENCSACHQAHDFRVEGDNCLACHQDIFEDGGLPAPPPAGVGREAAAPVSVARFAALDLTPAAPAPGSARHLALASLARQEAPAGQARPPIVSGQVVFRHANHRDVECTACHTSEERHGAVTIQGIADCRTCHHTGRVAATCQTCHTPPALADRGLSVTRTLDFSVAGPTRRTVAFEHGDHEDTACATCHIDGLTRPFDVQSCNGCHEEHHRTTATCVTCHAPPVATAHTVQSHLSCTGSGCHTDTPFEGVPRERAACLVCHQDLQDHQPGRECVDCHALPTPLGGAAS
jgi:hypothetical protein